MLRNAFMRNTFEGNRLALEPAFAGVHSSVSNWERYGVSSHRLHQHGDTKPVCIHPSRSASGCVKPARGLFTVHL